MGCFLLLALLPVHALLLRAAHTIQCRTLPQFTLPPMSFGKALEITAVLGALAFVLMLAHAIAPDLAPSGVDGVVALGSVLVLALGFLGTAGVIRWVLGTTFGRALMMTLVFYLLNVAIVVPMALGVLMGGLLG